MHRPFKGCVCCRNLLKISQDLSAQLFRISTNIRVGELI